MITVFREQKEKLAAVDEGQEQRDMMVSVTAAIAKRKLSMVNVPRKADSHSRDRRLSSATFQVRGQLASL